MKFTPIEIEDALQEAAARQRERTLRELRAGAALTVTVCSAVAASYAVDGLFAVAGLALTIFLLCASTAIWAAVESKLREEDDDGGE